jgi:hypothetical protein
MYKLNNQTQNNLVPRRSVISPTMDSDGETLNTETTDTDSENSSYYVLQDHTWCGLSTLEEYRGNMERYIKGEVSTSLSVYAPYDEDPEFTNLLLKLNSLGVLAVEWTRFVEWTDRYIFPIFEGKTRVGVNELVSAFLQVPDLEFVTQQGEHKILNVTLDHGEWLMRRHKPDGWTTGLDVDNDMFYLDEYFSVEADCVSFCVKT